MAQITVWRIVAPKYLESAFSGDGAQKGGGRFNSPGYRMVYTSGSFSLAMLELLVQANRRSRLIGYLCIPVPQESDYLINPLYPDVDSLKIGSEFVAPFDSRLIAGEH